MFKIPLFDLSSVFYTSCTKKEPYLFIGKTHKFKNCLNLMTLPQKPILLTNQILQNQRRITPLQRTQVQTRTTQVLTVPNLLLNLRTVAITLAHLSHQITIVQTAQNQLNIHITGLPSTRR